MILYIDPGTGSMLLAAILGMVSTAYFLLERLWIRIKYRTCRERSHNEKSVCDLIIFGEGGQYWKVFKPVCDELERRGFSCEYYTMDEKDPVLSEEYDCIHPVYIGRDGRGFAKLNMMKAKTCISSTPGLGVYQWKRSKGVEKYIHILHEVGEGTGYRMFGMDFYDVILTSAEFQERYIRILEGLREEDPKEVKVVGCPYMDALMERKKTVSISAVKTKTVLLAPSWGDSSILMRFGEKIIRSLLDTGYHVIIRPHPQSLISEKDMIIPLMEHYPASSQLEWDTAYDNFDSLSRADIMITDYSCVMFDYSLVFERPLIYADVNMDISPYDAAWIDEPVWRMEILPQIGCMLKEEDFDHLKMVIDKVCGSRYFDQNIRKIRDMAWEERGRAASNVVDFLQEQIG